MSCIEGPLPFVAVNFSSFASSLSGASIIEEGRGVYHVQTPGTRAEYGAGERPGVLFYFHLASEVNSKMPLFLIGDEQGYIKSLEYGTDIFEDGSKYKLKTLSHRTNSGQKVSIQRMALSNNIEGSKAVRPLALRIAREA